jgi:hypothetical protein
MQACDTFMRACVTMCVYPSLLLNEQYVNLTCEGLGNRYVHIYINTDLQIPIQRGGSTDVTMSNYVQIFCKKCLHIPTLVCVTMFVYFYENTCT